MASYQWQHLRFDVPAGLEDDTLVTLREAGPRPGFHVTIATTPTDVVLTNKVPLSSWVQQQDDAVRAQKLRGFSADAPRAHTIGGAEGWMCERRFAQGNGRYVQRQAFAVVGRDVVIVTATSDEASALRAWQSLDAVCASLRASGASAT